MQNSMLMFTFFVLYQKNPFLGKFGPKIQNWCSPFLFPIRNILLWKFVPKIIIVCWSWNLEPRLIWICSNFHFFLDPKYPFCVHLVQKFRRVSLRRNLVSRLIWICKIFWWCLLFLFETFFTSFVQKMVLPD